MGLFTDGFKELKKASEPLYKSPKSIQETIEIMAVAENGIFEVARNRYSKCYLFQDINYTTTNEDEQIDIFERYCKFLNSLDCNYKITVNNKRHNPQYSYEALRTMNAWIGGYNQLVSEKQLNTLEERKSYFADKPIAQMTEQDPEIFNKIIRFIEA